MNSRRVCDELAAEQLPDRRLAEIASVQHGIVTVAQLRALGIDSNATQYRMNIGRLHVIYRGVYAVGHRELTQNGRFLAAVMAIGEDAVLSHISAATLWGLPIWRRDGERNYVDVSLARRLRCRADIRCHTVRSLLPNEMTLSANIPITTPARTIADLAAVLPSRALRRIIHQAEVEKLVDTDSLSEQILRGRGKRGAHRLREIVKLGPAPTRSELEDRMLELLDSHELPRPKCNALLTVFARRLEVDFLFEDLRLVIETDGEKYHRTRFAQQADADKQALLETAGYRVLRLTWNQVTETPELTARRLRTVMDDQTARLHVNSAASSHLS